MFLFLDLLYFFLHLILATLKFLDCDTESIHSGIEFAFLLLADNFYQLLWMTHVILHVALGAKCFSASFSFAEILLFNAVFLAI